MNSLLAMTAELGPRRPDEQKPYKDLSGEVTKTEEYYFAYGGFSEVYKGKWEDPQGNIRGVAIKVLRGVHTEPYLLEVTTRRLNRETRIWHPLSHPNILPFLGVCYNLGASPALISPLCKFGNVSDFLKAHPDENRLEIAIGVAKGLEYLHSLEVVHGDMKPHNVLIDDDKVPRLCDFGRSRIVDHRGYTTVFSGTVRRLAPELLSVSTKDDDQEDDDDIPDPVPAPLTKKSDIFGFAMVALEIVTGKQPFYYIQNDSTVIYKIQSGDRPMARRYGSPDPKIWAILEACWQYEPELRPSMTDVTERFEQITQ